MITRNFNLYLNAGHSVPLVINVNQYDSGEQWVFTLYNSDGTQYTPSTGAIVGIKSDGLGIINTGSVDSDGRVVINETQQMTAAVGKAVFELMVDNQTHGTANFIVLVEPKPGDNADLSETDISMIEQAIEAASAIKPYGSPLVASTVAGMTDHDKVYVYVGSETGYTSGNWYYWDGSAWTSGGVYNSVAVQTDTTLTLSGVAADAKKTGDEISELKSAFTKQFGIDAIWEQGGLDTSTGAEIETLTNIRTKMFYMAKGSTVKATSGYNLLIFFYDPTGTYVTRTAAFNLNNPYTTEYDSFVRLVARHSNSSENITLDEVNTGWVSLASNQHIKETYSVTSETYGFLNMIRGGYIATNGAIGSVVNVNNIVTNNQWMYSVMPCHKGDTVWVNRANGGATPRALAILDSDYKLLWASASNSTLTNEHRYIDRDGFVIINSDVTYTDIKFSFVRISLTDYETRKRVGELENVTDKQFNRISVESIKFNQGTITSGVVTDSTTRIYSDMLWLEKGTEIVTYSGYQFSVVGYNELGTVISTIAISSAKKVISASGLYRIIVGKFSGNTVPSDGTSALVINGYGVSIPYIYDKVSEIKNSGFGLAEFDFSFDMKDMTDEMGSIDYSSSSTIMPQIYSLFDGLVSAYGSYVTKEDIAQTLGLTYPSYANGITGDSTYLDTPAYKTYMYKLTDNNSYSGNTVRGNAEKHRLLLVGATHGNEIAAPFNLYLLAKALCNPTEDSNLFKLRSAFDIYIIPCLNGYGMYHMTRVNANGVNINRNYPVSGWTVSGANTEDYTGASAGSEFETQVVIGATKRIMPHVAIDHHNYGKLQWQFYALVNKQSHARVIYKALTECSMMFIKSYPQYFGTGYKLFQDADGSSPQSLSYDGRGATDKWWYEFGVDVPACVEIGNNINYLNGVYESASQDLNGAITFSVGNYTLKNVLLHLCEISLNKC